MKGEIDVAKQKDIHYFKYSWLFSKKMTPMKSNLDFIVRIFLECNIFIQFMYL